MNHFNPIKLEQASPRRGSYPLNDATASHGLIIFPVLYFGITALIAFIPGLGKVLNIGFPIYSFILACVLYVRSPAQYVGFMWWMWFFTPLIRRIADYRSGFTEPSPMLLAPYLVSLVTLLPLYRNLAKSSKLNVTPFIPAVVAVIYGCFVGLLNRPVFIVLRETMDWLSPLSVGFYLAIHWRAYPEFRRTIETVFTWGILVMGVYGIYQFIELPPWDRSWLIESKMFGAAGHPDGDGPIRVWGTMQSGEPFSGFLAGGLLVLALNRRLLALPASIAGFLTFLLTLVRSGWLGWLGGMIILLGSLKAQQKIRLILIGLVLCAGVLWLSGLEPFSTAIWTRLDSLKSVTEDSSATGRAAYFNNTIDSAISSFLGEGIGGGTFDNFILASLFNLGWIGTILYTSGLGMLVWRVFNPNRIIHDRFFAVCRAVAATVLLRMPVNGACLGISGIILWGFLGLAIASAQYETYQRSLAQSIDPPSSDINLPSAAV
jgi:hypothetical protein